MMKIQSQARFPKAHVKTSEEEFYIFADPELKGLIGCISVSTGRG
jgi:hypothetical protein